MKILQALPLLNWFSIDIVQETREKLVERALKKSKLFFFSF